jgi:hypothetical protein
MISIDFARTHFGSRASAGTLASGALLVLAAACSSSSSPGSDSGSSTAEAGVTCKYMVLPQTAAAATCATMGGPATGAPDSHCGSGATAQAQVTGMCVGVPGMTAPSGDDATSADAVDAATAGGGDDASAGADAGNDGTCGMSDYGPTIYGTSGGDDDCKYDVSWTSTPVCENGNVYFTVTVKKRAGADGKPALLNEEPLTGASVTAEVYFNDCATIAPNSGQTTTELGNGMYKVGPIQFSQSGNWVVRFHFNECCSDDPADSPHGHAAFWVSVP